MTEEESTRVQALVDAALQRDPEERDGFLDAACAGRPSLRAAVASRLRAQANDADGAAAVPTHETPRLASDSSDNSAPRTVGPYIIRHEIGRGGMGVVYLADDTRLSRRVALKALPRTIVPDPDARERLRREARAAGALSHPGIATVYALEEIGDELYLACEYVPGPTLRSMLEQGPLPPAQVVDIALQLARALVTAHAQGVVHRDLKPENVVRMPSGIVKVLDFGVALVEGVTSTRLTHTGTIVGTPAYMAPEQAQGQEADFRTDLFAFGVMVYEMTSGSNPFEGRTVTATIASILQVDPPALSTVRPGVPPDLDPIVGACLRKRPEDRYQSTQELVIALEACHGQISATRDRPARRRESPEPDAHSMQVLAPRVARRWWRTHQLAVIVSYVVAGVWSWQIKEWLPTAFPLWVFVAIGLGAMISGTMRGHLLFTDVMNSERLAEERRRIGRLLLAVDVLIAASLIADGMLLASAKPLTAVLTMSFALGIALAAVLMEPATTAAAFSEDRRPAGKRKSGAKRQIPNARQRP